MDYPPPPPRTESANANSQTDMSLYEVSIEIVAVFMTSVYGE